MSGKGSFCPHWVALANGTMMGHCSSPTSISSDQEFGSALELNGATGPVLRWGWTRSKGLWPSQPHRPFLLSKAPQEWAKLWEMQKELINTWNSFQRAQREVYHSVGAVIYSTCSANDLNIIWLWNVFSFKKKKKTTQSHAVRGYFLSSK